MFFLRYITELITFSLPLNRKKKKKQVRDLVRVANVRVITDQIFPGLKKMLSILLGFRKHVRYVACMRARKLSLDSERLFVLSPGQIMGAIHSTKIQTGPTGKRGPPQKVDQFFRNFSGWTEPIH